MPHKQALLCFHLASALFLCLHLCLIKLKYLDVLLHFSLLKTIAMDLNATKYINLAQNLNPKWFQVNFSAKNDDFYIENDQSLLVDPFTHQLELFQ